MTNSFRRKRLLNVHDRLSIVVQVEDIIRGFSVVSENELAIELFSLFNNTKLSLV